ncbi:restriction endonuclease subunit S [Streptomyces sp. NPDC058257]|uniref:restriction endonuclease subunit S n=1 Tax=Streptomyces sp. NPDC058257 TaxID=3346409 RepID=UPI0036E93BC2
MGSWGSWAMRSEGLVHWVPVKDLGDVRVGKQLSPASRSGAGQRPYLRVANVYEGRIDYSDVNAMAFSPAERETYGLIPGDILLNEGQENLMMVGRSALYDGAPGTFCFQNTLIRFRPGPELLPKFAQAVFVWWRANAVFAGIAEKTSISHLGGNRFGALPFPLVSIAAQQRIVDVLDSVTELERGIEASIVKLKQLRRGLLEDAFRGWGRQKGEEPSSESKGWTTVSIGELCQLGSGSTPPRAAGDKYFADVGVPWVKTLDLNEGSLSTTDEALTPAALKDLGMRVFPADSVLVAMYGGWEQIGRTAILRNNSAVNQAISVLIPQSDLDPDYLLLALQHGRHKWRRFAASTRKDPNITKSDVRDFQIPVPPIEDQARIAGLGAALLREVAGQEAELAKVRELKRGLVDDLLSGRVGASALAA